MEIKETNKKEVGMSFEPRTRTTYEIRDSDDEVVGHYKETRVYQKDGKTLVTKFGEFVGN